MTKHPVLILGARSDIAMAVAHRFARAGHDIQLAARNAAQLEADKTDIQLRYRVLVSLHEFDALATATHEAFVEKLPELPGIAICAVGYMGDQNESERSLPAACLVMRSNYEGPASILAVLANRFEDRGNGTLVGISSVAGERGRATNYVYGSAKAGFTAFLSGLRSRLSKTDVQIITVLPGFVLTKMTTNLNTIALLTATPAEVSSAIFMGIRKGRNIIYVRPIWFFIMKIILIIPESIFKRLKI